MTESDDDMETARMDVVQWLPPVATSQELPSSDIRDGALCFVHGSDSVWQYRGGQWNEVGRAPAS